MRECTLRLSGRKMLPQRAKPVPWSIAGIANSEREGPWLSRRVFQGEIVGDEVREVVRNASQRDVKSI